MLRRMIRRSGRRRSAGLMMSLLDGGDVEEGGVKRVGETSGFAEGMIL